MQSYILLRRWQANHKDIVIKDCLSLEQLDSLGEAYFLERSYAIESLKLVIQLAEGGDAPFSQLHNYPSKRLQQMHCSFCVLGTWLMDDGVKPCRGSGIATC